MLKKLFVAPARERGLKYINTSFSKQELTCRSREGAWIEIPEKIKEGLPIVCRSREGAWIEISMDLVNELYGDCRSREGAWIEILPLASNICKPEVSLPRGSVD